MSWYLAVMKNYAGFRGRARRREYWMFVLVNAIIGVALVVIGKLTKMPDGPTFGIGMSRNGLGVFGIHGTRTGGPSHQPAGGCNSAVDTGP